MKWKTEDLAECRKFINILEKRIAALENPKKAKKK